MAGGPGMGLHGLVWEIIAEFVVVVVDGWGHGIIAVYGLRDIGIAGVGGHIMGMVARIGIESINEGGCSL